MEYLTMADIWRFTLPFLALIVMIVASWVVTQALFPKFVRYAQESYSRPFLSFLIGLGAAIVAAIVMALFTQIGHGLNIVASVLGGVVFMLALAGSAGLARRVGNGMQHPTDKDQPWRRTLRGGVTLGLVLIVPFLDIIPFVIIIVSGLGVSIRALWRVRVERAVESAESLDTESYSLT